MFENYLKQVTLIESPFIVVGYSKNLQGWKVRVEYMGTSNEAEVWDIQYEALLSWLYKEMRCLSI